LRNVRKKLKLREKLRRTYYDENDEYEGKINNNEKKNIVTYSRFFLTNIDLKESLQEINTIDLKCGLVDDADKSRFYSVNNYTILDSNYKNYNFFFNQSKNNNFFEDYIKLQENLEDSCDVNDDKEKKEKFKKHFYDNSARYIFSAGINDNFIRKNILKKYYKNKSEYIDEISEMHIDITKSKFLETSLDLNSNSKNYNSEKKKKSLIIEEKSVSKKTIINDFMHKGGGVYEIKYDEINNQNIIKTIDRKVNKEYEPNDFVNKTANKDNIEKNYYIRGIYSNIEFDNPANFLPSNLLHQVITTESIGLKDNGDLNSNFVITNYEEKNALITSNNKDRDLDNNLRSEYENKNYLSSKISSKTSAKNEKLKEDLIKKTPEKMHLNNQKELNEIKINYSNSNNVKRLDSFKTIQENDQTIKNNSNKKYFQQKSLERNQSTKNLLIEANHLKRISKDYDYENNDVNLNIVIENDISNKLVSKEIENNYYNIQTRKSMKKNNYLIYNPQKPQINLYSDNNKFKKNVNLNRNISGSPNNRINNLNSNDLSNKDNYRNYYESKLYKEKKDRNAKIINYKNRITEKDKSNNNNKDFKNNLISKSPFKLVSEYDSNNIKKTNGLNRVQSVQDLHGEKMKIDGSLFDSKEKKSVLFYSKSLKKNKSTQIIEINHNLNRKSDSNKYIANKLKTNESKKSPFKSDSSNYIRDGSYTKGQKTLLNNNNTTYKGKFYFCFFTF